MEFLDLDWASGEDATTFYRDDFFPAKLVLDPEDLDFLATEPDSASNEAESDAVEAKVTSSATRAASSSSSSSLSSPSPTNSPAAAAEAPSVQEESEEQKNRRRAVVAAASRATRAKRKRERETLQKRNEDLEKEREIYLSRIAQLQTEVQSFRDAGSTNLEKENELLRVEIRKHKAFIRSIVDATRAVPKLTPEEQLRLCRKGVESAVSQVLGLTFTSTVDSSWSWSKADVLTHENKTEPCNVGAQALPFGCEFRACKRLNFRLDLPLRPESVEVMREKIWTVWTDPELLNKLYEEIVFAPNMVKAHIVEIDTGFDRIQDSGDPDPRVFHYTEEFPDGPARLRDCVFAITSQKTKAFANAAFPVPPEEVDGVCTGASKETAEHVAPHDATSAISKTLFPNATDATPLAEAKNGVANDVYIICNSSGKDEMGFKPQEAGIHRIAAPLIEGHVVRPGPGGHGSYWTMVMSLPMLDTGFAGCNHDGELVNDDLSPGEKGVAMFNALIVLINSLEIS